ncbi:MOSC domain-containing protein [Alphaproteobacteria bacterium KMM 3653]|uniref:MOSC domain-containing protein n=1 Tax=Harenicola maris TaxID=2841044 RepID=A0AAP2G6U3_9RHOB|nr:MOSC domain-containing protein [Harenicola maris]
MGAVAEIWRHPLKAHGREEMTEVRLEPGKCLPWDRTWAVAHEASSADGSEWVHCNNFTRGAKAPQLMAITSRLEETTETLHLAHPERPDLAFRPGTEEGQEAFLKWVAPLMPEGRAQPARIISVPGRGLTDNPFPSISIANIASHRAVEQKLGRRLSMHRWRANIWLDGLPAWEEFDWVGAEVTLGEARLKIVERIGRCAATTANPETGERDADTLGTLREGWDHTQFSVAAEVVQGGTVSKGDTVTLL